MADERDYCWVSGKYTWFDSADCAEYGVSDS